MDKDSVCVNNLVYSEQFNNFSELSMKPNTNLVL